MPSSARHLSYAFARASYNSQTIIARKLNFGNFPLLFMRSAKIDLNIIRKPIFGDAGSIV